MTDGIRVCRLAKLAFFESSIDFGRSLPKLRSTLSGSSFFRRIIFLALLISFEGFAATKRMIKVYSFI